MLIKTHNILVDMFQSLSGNFSKIFDKLRGVGYLRESDIDQAMSDIRTALLEADVALPVVKEFISKVSEKALGQEVIKSVQPGQMVVKIIHDEMIEILSSPEEEYALNLKHAKPVFILMAGLQGSGKTTTAAKLANKLKAEGKKVLLSSLDTYRPAAQQQLEILASAIGVGVVPIIAGEKPIEITKRTQQIASNELYDVVILDSAGRLHIDEEMLAELDAVKALATPHEILFIADAMTGQDAVNIAREFNDRLDITGVVLTRVDGDSRGGAALSIKYITGKPIKFLGVGEKIDAIEIFDPKRIASRILDMGDIVSLVEKASALVDEKAMERATKRMQKGLFDLSDYATQLGTIKNMGGMGSILKMIPGASKMMGSVDSSRLNDKVIHHQEAIILSMTKKERRNPDLLNASRKKRIAEGSGRNVQEVNKLLKQYKQISDMMKKASKLDPKALARADMSKFFS